ncbi:MAG: hypothetical protein E7B29_14280 [Mixta calida]|nr:hypothetical protein [Mixta calida]
MTLRVNLLKRRFNFVMQFIQFMRADFPPAQFIYSESALLAHTSTLLQPVTGHPLGAGEQ